MRQLLTDRYNFGRGTEKDIILAVDYHAVSAGLKMQRIGRFENGANWPA